jgi:hypothetical protein
LTGRSEQPIRHIVWAYVAYGFLRGGFAEERLCTLVEGGSYDGASTPETHLSDLYITVLKTSIRSSYVAREKLKHYTLLRTILGTIVTIFSPLSIGSLSSVLLMPRQTIDPILQHLHATLDIPKDPGSPVRLHHPSFRDFLLDKMRCTDAEFWVNEKVAHQTLAFNCIQLMSSSRKQDICGFNAPGVSLSNIPRH